MKNGFEKSNINLEEAIEREVFRAKVLKMEGVQGRKEKNAGSTWTKDMKKRHSEKMKEYWRIIKEQSQELKLACGP